MYYKLELIIGQEAWDVTDCLVNWDEVEVNYARSNYDGVMRSFTNKFEFAGDAFVLITDEYRKNYLQAQAKIVYYTRNNSWLWNERFRCSLDFATLTYTTTTCEINAVDDSLASLIKAKKGTQYEYSVDRIKDGKKLMYDRIGMKSNIKWIWSDGLDESLLDKIEIGEYDNVTTLSKFEFTPYSMPVFISDSEISAKNIIEVYDVSKESYNGGEQNTIKPFLKWISDKSAVLKINIDLTNLFVEYESNTAPRNYYLNIRHIDGSVETLGFANTTFGSIYVEASPKKGDELYLYMAEGTNAYVYTIEARGLPSINVSFYFIDEAVEVDVVKPVTLLNRLLQSMNGGMEGITGKIAASSDGRLENTVLAAADSVRGLGSAKLYTSYTKFCTWMEAEFGYVPVVDDAEKKVTFVHRDSLFKEVEVKDLGDECTDFEFSVNESLIYARVRAGYDKQDYESVNGRDEWRFTSEYSTGVTLTDNALELISPYRADAYGIEFLAAKRGEETTDDESDNDVFMIGVEEEESQYVPMRGGAYTVDGVISTETMFNVMYSQRYMLEANARFLGVFAKTLERTSAEGNGEVTVGGVREDADVTLPEGLFTAGELTATTGDTELPEDLGGYVRLKAGGLEYTGYVNEVGVKYGREEAVTYEMLVRN